MPSQRSHVCEAVAIKAEVPLKEFGSEKKSYSIFIGSLRGKRGLIIPLGCKGNAVCEKFEGFGAG